MYAIHRQRRDSVCANYQSVELVGIEPNKREAFKWARAVAAEHIGQRIVVVRTRDVAVIAAFVRRSEYPPRVVQL